MLKSFPHSPFPEEKLALCNMCAGLQENTGQAQEPFPIHLALDFLLTGDLMARGQ